MADGLVAGTQGFHYSNHRSALQDDDEQSADHRYACHDEHQSQDNPYIQVHQAEPLEDVRIQLLDGGAAVGFSVMIYGTVHLIDNIVFRLVELVEVLHGQLGTACLVILPSIQLHGCIEVGIDHQFIILLEIGLVDARDGKPAHSHALVVDEVGEDALAVLQLQLVCHQLGNQNLVMAGFVIKLRYASFHHVLMDEGRIEIRSHTLEHYAQEIVVGLEDSFFHGKALHMFHAWNLLEHLHHRVVHHHRILVLLLQGHEVRHLDMASEANHLVADGVLESQHHAYRHDHDGKSDGNTGCGNMNSRARNLTFVALITI